MTQCGIQGCDREAASRWGWCNAHYKKWRKYGDPEGTGPLRPRGRTRQQLFEEKINKTDTCWLWTGRINKRGKGYGVFTYREPGGKPISVFAHRYAYELWVGPIPAQMSIDHVWPRCQRTECCRPDHLEPVTPREQNARYYGRQTHCKRGHEFTDENTLWGGPNGRTRSCKECGRRRAREHYRRAHPGEIAAPFTTRTCCKNGHEFTPENTRWGGPNKSVRRCRQCAREATARLRARQRATSLLN